MGLDFSYLLYFKRDNLWDAMQGLVKIAEPHHPPTMIHFPNHELSIPLDSWLSKEKEIHHDDHKFSFATVLFFDEDEAILDWGHGQEVEDPYRSPPGTNSVNRVSIGYIYLTVYNNLSQQYPENTSAKDLVLFDFGTTGTRMSLLFDNSTSIRETFIRQLEKYNGVCGVFNRESGGGELFWLKGQILSEDIWDAFMMPDEIEDMLRKYR